MTTQDNHVVVDQFAGGGGWDEALVQLGLKAIGFEINRWACATARAAGHCREEVDVASVDPLELGPVWGQVGSPPCQGESLAGKGLGRLDRPHVVACARDLADGRDTRRQRGEHCKDARSLLSIEPLLWALALRPEWIALEQVPPVLGLWELFAALLSDHGYHCDVGLLSAERYGVPQTRRRAYLIANRTREVTLPAPTHRSYDPRHPDRIREDERQLQPWVSMAEALGWAPDAVNQTNLYRSERLPHGKERRADRPSRTIDSKSSCWTVTHPPACEGRRHQRSDRRRGHAAPSALDRRQPRTRLRPTSAPAPTMMAGGLSRGMPVWTWQRPATTVAGDPRVQPPGHKRNASDPPGRYPGRAGRDAVRVSVEQASVLQGFRHDYPWQGSRKEQFVQVGNAVCPPVARRVLAAAIGLEGRRGA